MVVVVAGGRLGSTPLHVARRKSASAAESVQDGLVERVAGQTVPAAAETVHDLYGVAPVAFLSVRLTRAWDTRTVIITAEFFTIHLSSYLAI